MPVTDTKTILERAFRERYGVAAINVVNDLTMRAVLDAAVEQQAPVIVQTSVKTVRAIGLELLVAMWREMTAGIPVPVALHLDHCPDRQVITECLRAGWNSVLFDASSLPVAENQRQTVEVVKEAREVGAHVEGEIESITGVEDGIGSDEVAAIQSLDTVLEFIGTTGVDVFAPAIGNAHGVYKAAPTLDAQRVTDIVEAAGIPVALHGGTGMTDAQFTDLIGRGCAKVNISTALKVTYMQANLAFLKDAEARGKWDPPSLFTAVHAAVKDMAADHMRRFGVCGARMTTLIFDCDGVLADTERYGHLPAFNQTFAEFGLPVRWSEADYAEKLRIGGGKERMTSLLTPAFVTAAGLPPDPAAQWDEVARWHRRKTEIYTGLVGDLPGRPGIARLTAAAREAGWQLAVASTSAERSVRAVLEHVVPAEVAARFAVFAGDVVPRKKPAPDIYELAVRELHADPADTLVIEDSANGLRAALDAGLTCVVTVSSYTADEDFTGAARVVSSLGDPDGEPTTVLAGPPLSTAVVELEDLVACLPRSADA